MKTKIIFTFLLFTFIMMSGKSQYTFSISQGIGLSNTQLGYKVNEQLIPYIGFQYMRINTRSESTGKIWDYDLDKVIDDKYQSSVSANVFIPTLGLKYLFNPDKELRAYVSANVSKPFIRAKAEYDSEIENLNDDLKKLKLWGFELGAGAEYFFSNNFSLGGEFGIRYWHGALDDSYGSSYYNPNTGTYIGYEREIKSAVSLIPTYSKVSINFYF